MTLPRFMSSWTHALRCVRRSAAVAALLVAPPFAIAGNTFQDFTSNFPPPPDPSQRFMRITDDNVANNGQVGLGQVPSNVGAYDNLTFDFDFRINDPATGADGFGFLYLPVATNGISGAAPALSEEPNVPGMFGVGFDTWNNGDHDDNNPGRGEGSLPDSLSIHWDNAQIGASLDMVTAGLPEAWLENAVTKHARISITPGVGGQNIDLLVTEPSTGLSASMSRFAAGMTQYDGRLGFAGRTGGENQNQDVDNIYSTFTPAGGSPITTLISDFDVGGVSVPVDLTNVAHYQNGSLNSPTLVNGTRFWSRQHDLAPEGVIVPSGPLPPGGGVADGEYELTTDGFGSQQNSIAFDRTLRTMHAGDIVRGRFDIRVVNTNVNTADGMSMMLMDTTVYGETGPLAVGHFAAAPAEDPNFAGVVALGFDTFDNDEDFAAGDPNGCGGGGPCLDRRANSISAHANGAQLDQQFLPNITYDDGNWIRIQFELALVDDGSGGLAGFLDVLATDLTTGEMFPAFGGLAVPNVPANLRVAFAARTGGEWDGQFVDNINIVPEPSSILIALSAFGLVAVGQRRKWLSKIS